MTNEELKVKSALEILGYKEIKEVSKRDLYYSYLGLEKKYNPKTCTSDKYINGEDYQKLQDAYEYLTSDICKTNELIRNILYPENKEYIYSTDEVKNDQVKTEIIENYVPNNEKIQDNQRPTTVVLLKDKPSIINMIISFLVPFYGILYYFLVKRMAPKASKWYIICALIGVIINIIILYL